MLSIIISRLVQFLLMLVTLKVSTYLLAPAEMGKMALVTSSVAFVSLFLVNPIGMYIYRNVHTWNNEGQVRHYLSYFWRYIFLVALLFSIILGFVNYSGIVRTHLDTYFFVFFVFAWLFFSTINQTSIPLLNIIECRFLFMILSTGTVFFGLLFAILFVSYFGQNSEFWLLGILAGQVLLAVVGTRIFYARINPPLKNAQAHRFPLDLNDVLAFSWPIAIAVGLTWFQSLSYRFFIEHIFGLKILGLFVAGYGISAGIIAAFESIFTTYFQPVFYKELSLANKGSEDLIWNNYAAAIIPSLILLFFVITALAPKLTLLMLAKEYQDSAKFVVWGAFIEAFRVLVNVYGMVAHAKKDTKMLITPNLIGALVSVSFMYFLTPILGIVGIGLSLAAAGLLTTAYLHYRVRSTLVLIIPYSQLMKAFSLGALIWCINYYLGLVFAQEYSVFFTLAHISVIGIIVLFAELLLLYGRI